MENNAAIQPTSSVVEQAVACHNGCLSRWHFRDEARFVAVMSCFLQNGNWSYDSWLIIRLYDPPVSRIACARHSTYRAHLGDWRHQEKLHYFFVLFCTFKVRNFSFSYLFLPFLPLKSRYIYKKYKKVKKSDDTFPDAVVRHYMAATSPFKAHTKSDREALLRNSARTSSRPPLPFETIIIAITTLLYFTSQRGSVITYLPELYIT